MKTVMSYCGSGNAPYLIAVGIAKELGVPVIVNKFFRFGEYIQAKVLRKRFGNDPDIFIDEGSGRILSKIEFSGKYDDFVKRNVRYGEEARRELKDYIRGFEAVSLAGERREFRNPEIRMSVWARFVPDPENTYYVSGALTSEIAKRAPTKVKQIDAFIRYMRSEEKRYKRIFIPETATFSYMKLRKLPQQVSTPPLASRLVNRQRIARKFLYYNLSGATGALDRNTITAAEESGYQLYRSPEARGPGLPAHPSIIFNDRCQGVVARAGWGTLWECQLAGVPILTPAFGRNEDPEIYHNHKTIEKFRLGVIYDKGLTPGDIERAAAMRQSIRELNRRLEKKFGTLDGYKFVARNMKESIASHY